MVKPLKLVAPLTATEQIKIDAVEILREELKRAKSGEILGVIVITKDADGMWTHHTTGSISIREEIGAIESLKWDRLYRNNEES